MFGKLAVKSAVFTLVLAAFGAFDPVEARADGTFDCLPTAVAEYSNRVHVRCSNTWAAGGDTIEFIAIDKTDDAETARFVAMGNAALLGKKKFSVYLLTSSTSNVSGCLSTNCRTPTSFGVKE
jgi:hypothetical protein